MKKVVAFGEIMLRLSPPGYQLFEQAQAFEAVYGGSEANVAISLARFGIKTDFVTRLPQNPLGEAARQYLNRYGVSTDHIVYGGDRLGIYFLEKGYSIRPSQVVYDRHHSSFATARPADFNFAAIFSDADWFHVSGITAALSEELFQITKTALQKAKEMGLTTSCDLNYRQALWPIHIARKKMTELIPYVDVCIGIEPLELPDETGKDKKDRLPVDADLADYQEMMREIQTIYDIPFLAVTRREQLSVHRHRLQAVLSDGTNFYVAPEQEVEIVDRVGAGDAFSAGIIYALLTCKKPQEAIDFAMSCFALKHTIEGDANLLGLQDIQEFQKQPPGIRR